ncbi:MAG: beta-galactosidase [Kiritimatiellae bacterium]|nr:beta-galactosidase [Kiritimatiellia bacterium]
MRYRTLVLLFFAAVTLRAEVAENLLPGTIGALDTTNVPASGEILYEWIGDAQKEGKTVDDFLRIVDDNPHSGPGCLEFVTRLPVHFGVLFPSRKGSYQAGETFTASAYIRGRDRNPGAFLYLLAGASFSPYTLSQVAKIACRPGEEWRQFSVTAQLPTNAAHVCLLVRGGGIEGIEEVWNVDDVRIEAGDKATPVPRGVPFPPGARLVLAEDFNTPEALQAWRPLSGTWEVREGVLHGNGPLALLTCATPMGSNVRVEYTAWTDTPDDLSALLAFDSGAGESWLQWRKNAYIFHFGTGRNTKNYIVKNGTAIAESMMEGFASGIVAGRRHRVIAQKHNENLTLFVDGAAVLEAKDPFADDVTGNQMAFFINSKGAIDDVRVYAFRDAAADTVANAATSTVGRHVGFDIPDHGVRVAEGSGAVVDRPTWIYRVDGEVTVPDPCMELVSGPGKPTRILQTFDPVSSGLIELDILAAKLETGIRLSLLDTNGLECAAVVVDAEGRFCAETPEGTRVLIDTIEYRRRGGPKAAFRFHPDRWYTLRMVFDTQAGALREVSLLNLYTELNVMYTRSSFDQGEYLPLGYMLPFARQAGGIGGFSVTAAGNTTLYVDNLCLIAPAGRRTVNGKDVRNAARELLGLDFPERKDPFDVKTYSLRHTPQFQCGYGSYAKGQPAHAGASFRFLRDNPDDPKTQAFVDRDSTRYNDLLVRQAFTQEKRRLLERTAYHLDRGNRMPGALRPRFAAAALAARETDALLQNAYREYADAYVDNLNTQRLNARFAPAAEKLEQGLDRADGLIDGCLNALPKKSVAKDCAAAPCPAPAPAAPLVWRDGRYWRGDQPDFFYYCNNSAEATRICESLRLSIRQGMTVDPTVPALGPWLGKIVAKKGAYLDMEDLGAFYRKLTAGRALPGSVTTHMLYHACKFTVPRWWYDANVADTDIFWWDPDGNPLDRATDQYLGAVGDKALYLSLNFWNPRVRDFAAHHLEAVSAWAATNMLGGVDFYKLGWEAQNWAPNGHETGHNPSAKEAFRRFLRSEYGDVAALNAAWATQYRGFEEIEPPRERVSPCGVQYEFQRFRNQGYGEYAQFCRDRLRQHTPDAPLLWDCQEVVGGLQGSSFDVPTYFEMCDIVAYHTYAQQYMKLADRWLDSVAKVYDKTVGNEEWGMSQCNREMFLEEEYRNNALGQLFHRMMWGQASSQMAGGLWIGGESWTYGSVWQEARLGCFALRYASTFVPVHLDRASRFGRVALSAPTVQPDIGILEATSSYFNATPDQAVRNGMLKVGNGLEAGGYNAGFFYEKLLLEGRQTLKGVQTVVVPNGTCMPDALADMLAEWTRQGGALICLAPAGVYNQFGRPANRLLRQAFPDAEWQQSSEIWTPTNKALASIETVGKIPVYQGSLGRGTVVVFGGLDVVDKALEHIARHTTRSFHCRDNRFDLCMRASGDTRYLYVLNPSPDETAEDEVLIRGDIGRIIDRGLERPIAVPMTREKEHTVFTIKLAPSEGTLLQLDPEG